MYQMSSLENCGIDMENNEQLVLRSIRQAASGGGLATEATQGTGGGRGTGKGRERSAYLGGLS